MDKFQNKYRIASARAQWWDYGWNGAYFITICTAHREYFFGEIENEKMILSKTGIVADILWHEIPYHVPYCGIKRFCGHAQPYSWDFDIEQMRIPLVMVLAGAC